MILQLIIGILMFFIPSAVLWIKNRAQPKPASLPPDTVDSIEVIDTIIVEIEPEVIETKIIPLQMANFDIAYRQVARAEGGYQKRPSDPGNYNSRKELVGTNWGISAPVYESFLKRPPTEYEMRNMTKATARLIFKSEFWEKRMWGDRIHDQQLANIFFDGVVNHGQGVRLMQKALGIPQDNAMGPVTLNAINRANPATVFNRYREIRRAYYHQIVERNPQMQEWLNGWIRRIDHYVYQGSPETDRYVQQDTPSSGAGTLGLLAAAIYFFT